MFEEAGYLFLIRRADGGRLALRVEEIPKPDETVSIEKDDR